MKKIFLSTVIAIIAVTSATAFEVTRIQGTEKMGDCLSTGMVSCAATGPYYEPGLWGEIIDPAMLLGTFYVPLS